MRFFFFLLFYIIYLSNTLAQVQFSEESILLGFDNSCYGIGTFGGGISFFDFDIILLASPVYTLSAFALSLFFSFRSSSMFFCCALII